MTVAAAKTADENDLLVLVVVNSDAAQILQTSGHGFDPVAAFVAALIDPIRSQGQQEEFQAIGRRLQEVDGAECENIFEARRRFALLLKAI